MTSSQPTLQQVIAWAKEAGKIALDGFHTEHAIQMKGKLDLATEIDHACEKVLMDHIKQISRHTLSLPRKPELSKAMPIIAGTLTHWTAPLTTVTTCRFMPSLSPMRTMG